jgi:hypothetical protein
MRELECFVKYGYGEDYVDSNGRRFSFCPNGV